MALTAFDPSQSPSNQLNILDNAGFEIWQRGTTFNSVANNAYTADRWQYNNNTGTLNITQESTTKRTDSSFSLKGVQTGISSSNFLFQKTENFVEYRGKTVTFSLWVNASAASAVRLFMNDGVTTVNSSFHTGSGTFELLTGSLSISTSNTRILLGIEIAANNTFYLDNGMAVTGPNAATFAPVPFAVDFARCQRYYQKISGYAVEDWLVTGQVVSSTESQGPYRFPVEMRVAPTMASNAPTSFRVRTAASDIACTAITPFDIHPQGFLLRATVASGLTNNNAAIVWTNNDANAYITASADL